MVTSLYFLIEVFIMEQEVTIIDVLKAFEPTGFSSGATVILGCLALVFIVSLFSLFGYMMMNLILPIRRRADEFEELINDLDQNFQEQILSKDIWDNEVSPKIAGLDWLEPEWRDFRNQCRERKVDGKVQLQTFDPPDNFFIHINPLPKGFASKVPSMLTAFGILGTFIGIVIGLSQIGGQMGGDADQLKGAMGNLIGSLGVSFRTSIWGLILSVVSTILYTNARSKLDEQIERWVVWLEKTMPQTSIHKIAVEQLVQVEQQTKISYQQLQVVTGLGKEIGTSIEKAMGGGEMVAVMKELKTIMSQEKDNGMEQLVQSFIDQMNSRMGEDFNQLGTALKEMVEANKAFQYTMGELVESLKSASSNSGDVATQMQEAITSAATAMADMKGSLSGLSTVTDSIQEAAGAMSSMLAQQNSASNVQSDSINSLMSGLQNQSSNWLEQQASMAESTEDIRNQLAGLAEAVTGLIDWHQRVKVELGTQISSLMAAIEAQKAVSEKLTIERRESAKIAESISKVTASIAPAANEMVKAGDAIRKASEGLFATEKSFNDLALKVEDNVGELTDRQIQAISEYDKILQALNRLGR